MIRVIVRVRVRVLSEGILQFNTNGPIMLPIAQSQDICRLLTLLNIGAWFVDIGKPHM